MRTRDYFWYSFTHLKRTKGRSSLTVLGVALGVMALISIAAISTGFSAAIRHAMETEFNVKTIAVVPLFSNYTLTTDDVERIRRSISPQIITPVIISPATVIKGGVMESALLMGANISQVKYIWPEFYVAELGTLPRDEEWNNNDTAIVGHKLAEKLGLKNGDIIQVLCTSSGRPVVKNFTVVAVLKYTGMNLVGIDVDNGVLINVKYAKVMVNAPSKRDQISLILILTDSMKSAQYAATFIENDIYQGQVRAIAFAAYARAIENIDMLFRAMLQAFSIIALLIAGMGVMNTMFTSVRERIKEIGTIRAVGATRGNILLTFLAESILIGIFGTIAGVFLGLGVVYAIDKSNLLQAAIQLGGAIYIEAHPILTLKDLIISAIVGLTTAAIFGYWPARAASRLEPVVALRYE